MKTGKISSSSFLLVCMLLLLLFTGCAQNTGPCPTQSYADLSGADKFLQDDALPFRFPLDDANPYATELFTQFCTAGRNNLDAPYKYHAAEDYFQPAGTPVYAMADGKVSFSGRMGGYGWLVIIDHPQFNIYSLYGHLSPSRWLMKTGPVTKGELIGYLGDSHENGGSMKQPLEPHLHLGIRAGQRSDYPGSGEWRWMAGWIHPCPVDLGWLRPSEIIAGQGKLDLAYEAPTGSFLARWGIELLFALIYFSGALGTIIFSTKNGKLLPLFAAGAVLLVAGWLFFKDGWRISPMLLVLAILLISLGIKRLAYR